MPTPHDVGAHDVTTYAQQYVPDKGVLVTVTRETDDGTILVGIGRDAGPDAQRAAFLAAVADLDRDPDEDDVPVDREPARLTSAEEA